MRRLRSLQTVLVGQSGLVESCLHCRRHPPPPPLSCRQSARLFCTGFAWDCRRHCRRHGQHKTTQLPEPKNIKKYGHLDHVPLFMNGRSASTLTRPLFVKGETATYQTHEFSGGGILVIPKLLVWNLPSLSLSLYPLSLLTPSFLNALFTFLGWLNALVWKGLLLLQLIYFHVQHCRTSLCIFTQAGGRMVCTYEQADCLQETSQFDCWRARTNHASHSESRHAGADRTGEDWVSVFTSKYGILERCGSGTPIISTFFARGTSLFDAQSTITSMCVCMAVYIQTGVGWGIWIHFSPASGFGTQFESGRDSNKGGGCFVYLNPLLP